MCRGPQSVALGDMNIAPLENAVWDHKKMVKVVSHTPVEVEKFVQFYDSLGWTDGVRKFVPEDEKLFSWWSYRAKDWDAADRGRRLDHIWVTDPLAVLLKPEHGRKILGGGSGGGFSPKAEYIFLKRPAKRGHFVH